MSMSEFDQDSLSIIVIMSSPPCIHAWDGTVTIIDSFGTVFLNSGVRFMILLNLKKNQQCWNVWEIRTSKRVRHCSRWETIKDPEALVRQTTALQGGQLLFHRVALQKDPGIGG